MKHALGVLLLVGSSMLLCATTRSIAQDLPLYTKWVNYTAANGFPKGEVYSVAVNGNQIWAGTEHGLVLVEDGRVKKAFTTADGLAGDAVISVAVSKETGDVWAGTFGGLSRYSAGQFKNYTDLTSGLANDLVYSVAIQGRYVWAATAAGISRLNTDTGGWKIFTEQNSPFSEPWGYGVAVGATRIYMGLWGGGVLIYNPIHKYWRRYTDPDESMEIVLYRNQGLIHNMVSSIAYDRDTRMFWAGTYFGLSGYDGRNWHNYLTKDSGLASNFINGVEASGNIVWVCTQKGLNEFDYKTNTWVTYRPVNWRALDTAEPTTAHRGEILIVAPGEKMRRMETPTSLAHNYVLNMAYQGKTIWVATADGLSHGFPESPKTEQHSHPANQVN